ncbi:hypothetical protein KI387_025683, partial [Taxus chinensis]
DCITKKALAEAKQIHSHINNRGHTFGGLTLLPNKLIYMYDKCESLMDARKVFNCMTDPDLFSWNM